MLIEEKPLRYWIENFYGYGAWHAPFWFIGYEESGGDLPEEVAEKINYFYLLAKPNPDLLCDIRAMYREVAFRIDGPRAERFATLYDQRFGPHPTLHGSWKNMIAFAHGYENQTLPDLISYQQHDFLSLSAPRELLLQLYPLPAHNHAWYYAWLDMPNLPFLKSRARYEEHVFASRMQTLFHHVGIHRPKVVLMYGMENINLIKESVRTFYPSAKFKVAKAVKLQIPQHHRADLGETTLIITTQIPALRHNRVESGFDWYAFGEQLKAGS